MEWGIEKEKAGMLYVSISGFFPAIRDREVYQQRNVHFDRSKELRE